MSALLVVLAGLPGSGKSALAEDLSRALPATVLSVDPVEAALWRAGVDRAQPTGLAAYVVVEALAAEQLTLGHDVIVDACNDAAEARAQWRTLARRLAVRLRWIEVCCADPVTHRDRLAGRQRGLAGFREPTWESVLNRRVGFDSWDEDRLVVQSMAARLDNLRTAIDYLRAPA